MKIIQNTSTNQRQTNRTTASSKDIEHLYAVDSIGKPHTQAGYLSGRVIPKRTIPPVCEALSASQRVVFRCCSGLKRLPHKHP